jgi:carbon-monoxide dehydrogenase large subunit
MSGNRSMTDASEKAGKNFMKFGVGQPVRRVEDARLVTGSGRYTEDFRPAGTAFGLVVRSPHPQARFRLG